jgi:methylmalonyl-CoA/ethylmalonyl-CoA epimerase
MNSAFCEFITSREVTTMETNSSLQPAVNTKDKKIEQIGIVVKDAHKTAIRYSEVFGIGPWVFIDFEPTDLVYRNQRITQGASVFRAAMASLGKLQIKLLQPLKGQGAHASFLKERGEGIHHVSLSMAADYDSVISALRDRKFTPEMEGVVGGAIGFSYMDMKNALGTSLEFVKPPGAMPVNIKAWGTYAPKGPGLINMTGKEIRQIGIVVKDAEKTAQNYWELLGIGPWMLVDFKPPHVRDVSLHGISMSPDVDFNVRAALADFGDMQIELLEPVSGPSTYREFLETHGQGIHHVSFGESPDHDEVVSILKGHGIDIEMDGVLGNAIRFTYMATQNELGTIFEVIKTDPNTQLTLFPYGTYPPSK